MCDSNDLENELHYKYKSRLLSCIFLKPGLLVEMRDPPDCISDDDYLYYCCSPVDEKQTPLQDFLQCQFIFKIAILFYSTTIQIFKYCFLHCCYCRLE